jgi:LuxR family transcriptional regulator, quorum-sensing system regulator SolR
MSSIFDSHILFESANNVANICEPLKRYFNITDFNYEKIYKDCSKVKLTSRPDWIKYYHHHGYHLLGACEGAFDRHTSGYQLAMTMPAQEVFKSAREIFNIDYGIVIIEKCESYCEFFWFGSTRDNPGIINFYLNNINLLQNFILYFREKASNIIKKAEKQRIIVPQKNILQNIDFRVTSDKYRDFIQAISLSSYRLSGEYSYVTLTERESECIKFLFEGKTAKEIGNTLSLSQRTIETYIANIKSKVCCNTKSELLDILRKNGFAKYSNNDIMIL